MAEFLVLRRNGAALGGLQAVAVIEDLKADDHEKAIKQAMAPHNIGETNPAGGYVALRWDNRVEKVAEPGPPKLSDPPDEQPPPAS